MINIVKVWAIDSTAAAPGNAEDIIVLRKQSWNDWWEYETLFSVNYVDSKRRSHELGLIKVGQFDLPEPDGRTTVAPELPRVASAFDSDTFSLGQSEEYYENVKSLGQAKRRQIHRVLRDIAYNSDIRNRAIEERVTRRSLLREIPLRVIEGQLQRLSHGGVRLTEFNFTWRTRSTDGTTRDLCSFAVDPESTPPTNIHAIIGRNGVGKSTLLHQMSRNLVNNDDSNGSFRSSAGSSFDEFSNLVSVSFSAFDEFDPLEKLEDRRKFGYAYIGLGTNQGASALNSASLKESLITGIQACLFASRRSRWVEALVSLENDPIFAEVGLVELIQSGKDFEIIEKISDYIYPRLSSGHKIVLISITRLVASVEEKSLVLIDEPESHLHPPLLSAYVRALSGLLSDRNGVAIVATHSPVVLQELPRTCVWKLSRSRETVVAARPDVETFGENVGRLTNEVFGLEVSATGFHQLLTELALDALTYNNALGRLNGQLGIEGMAILRSRILADREHEQ